MAKPILIINSYTRILTQNECTPEFEATEVLGLGAIAVYPHDESCSETRIKIGDGTSTLSNLAFVGGDYADLKASLAALTESLDNFIAKDDLFTTLTEALNDDSNEFTKALNKVISDALAENNSIAGIFGKGEDENSLQGFDAKATAPYAVAIGSSDKTFFNNIVGDYNSFLKINIDPTTASGNSSLAFGAGSKALSAGSIVAGPMNTAGVKGYKIKSAEKVTNTSDTYQLILNTKDSNSPGSYQTENSQWYLGDTVCIYLPDAKYFAKGTITKISMNQIEVAGLPESFETNYSKNSLGIELPYDYTICAFYQETVAAIDVIGIEIKKLLTRWAPRGGEIELGWASTAIGVLNLASGNLSFVHGFNNWQVGDFGATFGFENIGGDYSLVAGDHNDAAVRAALVAGSQNSVKTDLAIVGGQENTIAAGSSASIVAGYNNDLTNSWCSAVFGRNNTSEAQTTFIAGAENTVQADYSAALGWKNKITNKYAFAAGTNNKIYTDYGIALGVDNEVSESNAGAVALGYGNKTSRSCQLVVGKYADTDYVDKDGKTQALQAQFVVGNGISDTDRKNVFIVHADGRATAGEDPVGELDLVTKRYFENNATKVDWDNIQSDVHMYKNLKVDGDLEFSGDIQFNSLLINNLSTSDTNKIYSTCGAAIGTNLALTGNNRLVVGDKYVTDANLIFAVGGSRGNFLTMDINDNFSSDEKGKFAIVSSGDGKASGSVRNGAVLGYNNTVNNDYSMALGYNNVVKGCVSTAIGCELNTLPVNLGQGAGYGQVVVGRYNVSDKVSQFIVGSGSSGGARKNALTVRALSGNETYSVAQKDTDAVTLGFLKTYSGGSGSGLPEVPEGTPDGAILVVRNGQWVIENPPTSVYLGE